MEICMKNGNMTLTQDIRNNYSNQENVHACIQGDVADCVEDDFEAYAAQTWLMKSERNRLGSFDTWPQWSNQCPERLAEAGLYYTGIGDRVRCPFCHGILKKWERWDVPFLEHRKHFPRCPFITGEEVGNLPIAHDEVPMQWGQNTSEFSNQAVNLLDFTREENRRATFGSWPTNKSQTPESLARAGFYHVPSDGKEDRVKCAYCRGKLYNWTLGEDPWTEHARCFPNCPYVKLCVDNTVIQNLQTETICRRAHEISSPSEASSLEQNVPILDDVTSCMSSDAVQAVLDMGFSPELVRKVISKYAEVGRILSLSAQQLASEVLELEERISGQEESNKATRPQVISAKGQGEKEKKTEGKGKSGKATSKRKESSSLKDSYLCSVCKGNEVSVTFLPCGHLTCCGQCSMVMSKCPVCKTLISGCVRTFF